MADTVRESVRAAVRYPTDRSLLRQVLRPYRQNCWYLLEAVVTAEGEPSQGGRVAVTGDFEIPESCYIDDTGHFNSVEFNICYNQMFYYLAAKSVAAGLAHPLSDWTMAQYWHRQLTDFLIVDFHSSFRRAMRGRRFSGELAVVDMVGWPGGERRRPLTMVHTTCRYWDDHGGRCHGEVKVAIVGPSGAAATAVPS